MLNMQDNHIINENITDRVLGLPQAYINNVY